MSFLRILSIRIVRKTNVIVYKTEKTLIIAFSYQTQISKTKILMEIEMSAMEIMDEKQEERAELTMIETLDEANEVMNETRGEIVELIMIETLDEMVDEMVDEVEIDDQLIEIEGEDEMEIGMETDFLMIVMRVQMFLKAIMATNQKMDALSRQEFQCQTDQENHIYQREHVINVLVLLLTTMLNLCPETV